jgi:hypothetical protein
MRMDQRDAAPFLIGLLALPAQAVLLREFLARCGGNEIVLTLALFVWLLGSAVGALVWRRMGPLGPHDALRLLGVGLLVVLSSLILARFVALPGGVPGELPRPWAIGWIAFLVLFPAAFFTAGLFPVVAAEPGRAYALEALGAMIGGVLTTALFVLRVPAFVILGGVAACIALAWRRTAGVLLAAAILILAIGGPVARLDDWLFRTSWEGRRTGLRLLEHAATPERTLALAEREGQRWLFADDRLRATLDDTASAEATAALLASCAPSPRTFLLVDFGADGTAAALARAGASRVLCLLPEREDTLFAPWGGGVEHRIGDPRRSIRNLHDAWDVVAIVGGEATSVAANRLWTEDAFRDMRARLAPAGVVLAITPGGDAAPGTEARAWRSSVAEAMRVAIGAVLAVDADRYVLAASRRGGDAALDPDSLRERYERGAWSFSSDPAARFAVEYPRSRSVAPAPAAPNRDDRPAAFAHALGRWSKMMGLAPGPSPWLALLVPLPLLLLPAFAGRREAPIVATGAVAMGLDLLVLMAYQARVGMLQAGLGALLGAFLGGTAIGAWIAAARRATRRWLPAIALIQILIACASGWLLPHLPASTAVYALAGLLLGVACGLPFPIVAMESSAARAWAADAAGGAIGAVAVLFLVSRGFVTLGFALAIPPLAAMTRVLGWGVRSRSSGRP